MAEFTQDARQAIIEACEKIFGEEVPGKVKETLAEQGLVMMQALYIFGQREHRYKDGWRARGWRGNVADLLRKGERIRSMFWTGSHDPREDYDDVVDLINYACFLIRNAQARNEWG